MIYNLQCLRAFAALSVASFHSGFQFNGVRTQFYGVALFFVISGFIMCLVSQTEGADFFARRLIRIVPLYWLTTVLVFVALSLGLAEKDVAATYLWRVARQPSFLMTWLGSVPFDDYRTILLKSMFFIPFVDRAGEVYPFLDVGWSLNLEILFYLLFALFRLLSVRWAPLLVSATIICVHMAAQALPGANFFLDFYGKGITLYFVYGVAVFYLWSYVPSHSLSRLRWSTVLLALTSLVLLVIASLGPSIVQRVFGGLAGVVFQQAPTILVLSALLMAKAGADLRVALVTYLGAASYSLYLTHQFVLTFLRSFEVDHPSIGLRTLPGYLLGLLACCTVALAFYRWVEVPTLNVFRRGLRAEEAVSMGSDRARQRSLSPSTSSTHQC